MTDYLPKHSNIEQACTWLQARTGETWVLPRLLEHGLMPWFWLDYTPGWPAIFGDRVEGYLAPMVFASDTQRLEADGTDALVNITRAHDGTIFKPSPGMRVPLSDLRFKRADVERVAATITVQAAPAKQAGTPPVVDAPDPERRLIALRALGGTARWRRGPGGTQAWQFSGIQNLLVSAEFTPYLTSRRQSK